MNWTEEQLPFEGPYKVFVDDAELVAEVRQGDLVYMTFRGEVAWSDAVRMAGDLNVAYWMREN